MIDDNLNLHDPRYRGRQRRPTLFVTVIGEDGREWEEERPLPTHYIVCPVCDGRGSVVNPNIDAHGLTAEDFHEDPDFAEDYFAGRYDQPCGYCGGQRVTLAVDEEALTEAELKAWRDQQIAEQEMRETYLAERRMGA